MAVVAVLAAGGLAGCGDDTTNNSKTDIANPNPVALSPTGTLQGQITDAVTGEVIVGAVVSIGTQSATTDATGHYVINNVPANNEENGTAGLTGKYQATLDLSSATSPVNMTSSATTPRYPARKPSMPVNVTFSSFNESVANGGTASNHDTPIVNLVANYDFKVGKLTATLSGVVTDNITGQPKGGATVELRDVNNNYETATLTDNALGTYSFAKIEAGVKHYLQGRDSTTSVTGTSPSPLNPVNYYTLSDNQTLDLGQGDLNALVLTPYDNVKPYVSMVSPENFADVAPGAVDVVLSFSEPIRSDAYSTPSAATALGNIYQDIVVTFDGVKDNVVAGTAVPHSLAWNSSRTALTVTIPATGTSSTYSVDYTNIGGDIKDVAGNVMAALPANTKVAFSTRGATAVTAPSVVVVNSASLSHVQSNVMLDWAPVVGATKGYKVYRADKRLGLTGPMKFLANATVSSLTDNAVDFISTAYDPIALSYDYSVSAVNGDNEESALSVAVTARDVIAPTASAICVAPGAVSLVHGPATTTNGEVKITFSETINESLMETLANYTTTPAVTVATQLQAAPAQVVLEFGSAITCSSGSVTLANITDLAGNAYAGGAVSY